MALKFILAIGGNWYSGWEIIKKGVPEADRVGFWGFVMPDHYMWGPNMGGDSTLDTWIALTYLVANFLACSRIDGYCCYFTVITNKLHLFIYLI